MKPLKTILTVFFICKALLANSQHKVSGILILSGSRDHMSFDLFVPGNIYKTKTLATNLVNLSDTAIRFGTYEGLSGMSFKIVSDISECDIGSLLSAC